MKNINIFGILVVVLSVFIGLIVVEPLDIDVKIGLLLLPLIITILLLNPMWSFMVLLFIRPLITSLKEYDFGGGLTLLGVFSLLNIVFTVFILIKTPNVRVVPKNIKWFYIYVVIAFLSSMNSMDILLSIEGMMKILSLLALFLLGYNLVNSLEDGLKIIRVILISAVIPLSYGIYQVISQQGATYGTGLLKDLVRVNATFDMAHGFAYYSGMIILLSILAFFHSRGKKDNIFNFLIIVGATICIVFTYTRAIWISTLLTLCFISIYERKIRGWLILSIIIVALFFYGTVLQRFDDLINPPDPRYGTNSFVFRTDITKQLLSNAMVKRPILGFGLYMSEKVATQYTIYDRLPHNDYMRVLIETGILGLTAYLVFLGKMVRYLLNLIRNKVNFHVNTIFLGILIYYLMASMSQNVFTYISTAGYIFVLMGLAQKINDISEINKENRSA